MISYKDLFDFNDDSELKKAIKVIEHIGLVYDRVITDQTAMKQQYKSNIKDIVQSTQELEKSLSKLDPAIEKDRQAIAEMSKTADVAASKYDDMKAKVTALEGTIGQLTKEQEQYNAKAAETIKLNKDKAKLDEKLASLNSDQAKEIAKVRIQIQERNKALKKSAQESLGLVSLYQKESKQLIDLRNRYKDVALSQGVNSKEAKKLQKEVGALDSKLKEVDANAGQFQRKVGNYPELFQSMGGATATAASGIQGVGVALKALIANPVGVVIMLIVGAVTLLFNGFKRLTGGAELLDKIVSGLTITFNTLFTRIGKLLTGELSLKEFIFDTGDAIKDQIIASNELISLRRKLEKVTADTTLAEAKLGEVMAKLSTIRDNDSKSLKQREEASKLYIEAIKKQNKIQLDLAEKELRVAKLSVDTTEQGSEDRRLAEIEYTNALAKQVTTRTETYRAEQDAIKELGMVRLDQFEQELDLLLDIDDRRKSVNERTISNEKTTLAQKQKLLKENVDSIESSYNEQIDTFKRYFGVQLDEVEILKLSGKELYAYTASLGLSERAVNRLREVVIEKQAADRDNLDTIRDVNVAIDAQLPKQKKLQYLVLNGTKEILTAEQKAEQERQKKERQRLASEKELRKELKKGWSEYYDQIQIKAFKAFMNTKEFAVMTVVKVIEAFQEKLATITELAGGVLGIYSGFVDRANQKDNERLDAINTRKEKELEMAGDNANQREAIERKYERQVSKIEKEQAARNRKRAMFEKALAISEAIIAINLATLKAGVITPKAIATAIVGGLKVLAIAATPIPAYKDGTPEGGHKGGLAVVGDGGMSELIYANGRTYVSPNKSTLVDLPAGAKVMDGITSRRAMNEMAMNESSANSIRQNVKSDKAESFAKVIQLVNGGNSKVILESNSKVIKAISELEIHQWKMTNGEITESVRKGNTTHKNWKQTNSY